MREWLKAAIGGRLNSSLKKNKTAQRLVKPKIILILRPLLGHKMFGAERNIGEMSEWFKERAWKVRIPQKGIGGSNPPLSAN